MAKETKNKDSKAKNEKKDNKNFLKEFKAELKRVSWPTFKQLVNNTTAVLAIILLTAVIVFVLDVIFENLNNLGVERIKAIVTSSSDESSDDVENDEGNVVDDNSSEAEESLNVDGGDAQDSTVEQTETSNTEGELQEQTTESQIDGNSTQESNVQ